MILTNFPLPRHWIVDPQSAAVGNLPCNVLFISRSALQISQILTALY
uniref:Uncharacterized protein n=1 Tax=Candidatus Kentrum sp. FW TaxID=2126338 RepID=A0A450SXY6_9GAMM|nr:MAG: hypothetical protein BECKFW1821B_GA0114236_104321 [Candidatus Kentron sp. FW]